MQVPTSRALAIPSDHGLMRHDLPGALPRIAKKHRAGVEQHGERLVGNEFARPYAA